MTSKDQQRSWAHSLSSSLWIPAPRPKARIQLLCFHHAGGHSRSFARWPKLLPSSMEFVGIELPRREPRSILRETQQRWLPRELLSADETVEDLLEAIGAFVDRPFVLFGHSMGAMLSYHLARRLSDAHGLEPRRVFVSAAAAPDAFGNPLRTRAAPLTDAQLRSEVARMGGTPPALLARDSFAAPMLSRLRADLWTCATISRLPRTPLRAPITAMYGSHDHVVSGDQMQRWHEYSGESFRMVEIEGDHFYPISNPDQVIDAIGRHVANDRGGD
jgi:surfactin synthase thioesterase subunit